MLILGVDPGTATTGWGVIKSGKGVISLVDYGCIVTSKNTLMPERLYLLQKEFERVLERHKPDVVCVEQLFFGANTRTAMTVGQARGVVMATTAAYNVSFYEYQGLAVKLVIAGHGRATKKEVERGVKKLLKLRKLKKPSNGFLDDAVDAIAIALCHVIKTAQKE